jgi:hypothetical protein
MYCVISRVEIETSEPAYPLTIGGTVYQRNKIGKNRYKVDESKTERRTVYPVGRFWTTLCGPELADALSLNRVVKVAETALYAAERPFASYAGAMIGLRNEARNQNDECREGLLKMLTNSFGGKMASRPGGWRTIRGKIPPNRWGEWTEVDFESKIARTFRSISGVTQEYVKETEDTSGFPSVFAYLTSYGRMQLLNIIRSAGRCNVIWCHTDGLSVTEDGYASLSRSGLIGSGDAGQLRVVGIVERARVFGPSHYFADGDWILSGFRGASFIDAVGTVIDWQRPQVSDLIARQGEPVATMHVRKSSLSSMLPSGHLMPDGFIRPLTVFNGEVQPPTVDDD